MNDSAPRRILAALLVVLCATVSDLPAASDRVFDQLTGRDTRNYPPDPQVDFLHIRLDLNMPDPMSRSFRCEETITFRAPERRVDRLDLDAVDLRIESVTDGAGKPLSTRYDDKTLTVRFDPPIEPRAESIVKIVYTCTNPRAGMIFTLPDDAYPDRPLNIHTQGQAETNRYWFACHDYPNELQTTEMVVTIPSKFSALSNGALLEKTDAGDDLTSWHYKLGRPHVSYLVSLVVGDFAVVTDTWRGKPVEYWVSRANEPHARGTFGRTPDMMELCSKLTGLEYPWEKYAQAVVYGFEAGGMENTSCTTLMESTNIDERAAIDSDFEGLIAHELAHQWFGDALTCRSWQHVWLNEGFATFMEKVWQEHAHGPVAYGYSVWQSMQGVASSDDVTARGGLAWPHYDPDNPFEAFGRTVSNPYSKGATVLHMLRRDMGDELFWKVIAAYVKRHAFSNVESDDLRKVCDELSGQSYEQFFQQWVYRPGSPQVKIAYTWDDAASEIRLTLEQTQTVSIDAPAFNAAVAVWLVDENHSVTSRRTLRMDSRQSTITIACEREPAQVVIDPQAAVLAKWERASLPTAMVIAQARYGPTPTSRFDAIAALADRDRDDVRAALWSIIRDPNEDYRYHFEALKALGRMRRPPARDLLLDALAEGRAIREPRARRAAVEALGEYVHDDAVVPTLLRFAQRDESYDVEAAATTALGSQRATDEVVDVLLRNMTKPANRDQIRTAAAGALAALGDPRGLEAILKLAAYGQPFRTRPQAIEAAGQLAAGLSDERQRATARDALAKLTDDAQSRSATAAIKALGAFGDDKAMPALKAIAASSAPKRQRDAAKSAIEAITKKSGESAAVKSLRERIEALEKARQHDEAKAASATTGPTTQP